MPSQTVFSRPETFRNRSDNTALVRLVTRRGPVLPGGGLELLCFRLRFAFADVLNFILFYILLEWPPVGRPGLLCLSSMFSC